MWRHLIYTIGPSGAGKDRLLGWLRTHLGADAPVAFAQRTVTRAADAGSEDHEACSEAQFLPWRDAGVFALHWQANGLHYGVRHTALAPLAQGHCVFVNGSRAYLAEAQRRFPGLTVLHITGSPDTLRRRLVARGREDGPMLALRMARAQAWQLPAGHGGIEIANDGTLDDAGQRLLGALQGRFGSACFPAPV
ncbi:MAG: phosphonate metabolism protein/1,5-bisphosphokinase (PRPP-forming) PhnN [Pseudomonadota bacterium]